MKTAIRIMNLVNATKSYFGSSLTRKTLLEMWSRLVIICGITSAIAYWHVSHIVTEQKLETIQRYVIERGQSERQIFRIVNENHRILRDAVANELLDPMTPHPRQKLEKMLTRYPDASLRSSAKTFDGLRSVGIYVPKDVPLTPTVANQLLVFNKHVVSSGKSWRGMFKNTFIASSDGALVLLWPEVANYVLKIDGSSGFKEQEWFRLGTLQRNSSRSTLWTGVYFDSIAEKWMVTASTPIDVSGNHVGIIGNALVVDELLDRAIHDRPPETTSMIIRGDGRLIAHSNLMDEIKQAKGAYSVRGAKDPSLLNIFSLISDAPELVKVIDSRETDQYVAFSYIPETDWYFVIAYPKSFITSSARTAALVICLVGVFALFLEIVIAIGLLEKQIASPLRHLINVTRKVADGQFSATLDESKTDEIGSLSRSFNQMIRKIADRDRRLEEHNNHLEKLVRERTTELENQRAAVVHASKMSSLGQMAGGIAHEINNPLAVIRLLCDELRESSNGPTIDSKGLSESIQMIETTTDRIASIVQGLRTFSRDGSGDPLSPANAQDLVKDSLSFCEAKFASNGISLEVAYEGEDFHLKCRPSQISQIIVNLLGNAFDAVSECKEKWVKVKVKSEAGWIEISVTDSGTGIPEDVVAKLFQPFFTTKEIGKGTGLGLSISHGIAMSHGGALRVDGECPNTRFVLRLPTRGAETNKDQRMAS